MMCELIAVGCLSAHEEFGGKRPVKLFRTYQADSIIKSLSQLHPAFYPRPVRQINEDTAQTKGAGVGPFMTKEELVKLYWYCGERLHVGTADNILKHMARTPDMPAVRLWHDKFIWLLTHHRIDLLNPHIELLVRMHGEKGEPVADLTLRQ